MRRRGGNVVAMPSAKDRPIPRSLVRVERDLLAEFVAQLDAGELTAGPTARSYLQGALDAVRQVLGEGQWRLPLDLTESSGLQDTND